MLVAVAPSLMTVKSSPSVAPCFQLASVRSDGFGGLMADAMLPSPLPDGPWQVEHWVAYSLLPASTDAGKGFTGFFSFAAPS